MELERKSAVLYQDGYPIKIKVCPVSAALASIFRMDSISTSYTPSSTRMDIPSKSRCYRGKKRIPDVH